MPCPFSFPLGVQDILCAMSAKRETLFRKTLCAPFGALQARCLRSQLQQDASGLVGCDFGEACDGGY